MSYSDQKYYSRYLMPAGFAKSFGTATASATDGANTDTGLVLPTFARRTKITGFKLICTTIPDAGSTALKAVLKNGTATVGTAVLTTATVGAVLAGVITSAANSVFTADTAPTFSVIGTATASADAQGSYDILFECQELPA